MKTASEFMTSVVVVPIDAQLHPVHVQPRSTRQRSRRYSNQSSTTLQDKEGCPVFIPTVTLHPDHALELCDDMISTLPTATAASTTMTTTFRLPSEKITTAQQERQQTQSTERARTVALLSPNEFRAFFALADHDGGPSQGCFHSDSSDKEDENGIEVW